MAPEHDACASAMLRVVEELLRDLPRQPQRSGRVTLDSSLDQDLGFDSLARVELLSRVERAFGVTLPEKTLQIAETVRDLLVALGSASTATRPAPQAYTRVQLQGVEGAHAEPADAITLPQVLDRHIHVHGDRAPSSSSRMPVRKKSFTPGSTRARRESRQACRDRACNQGRRWRSCCPHRPVAAPPPSAA